jgi:hypothetical protein
VNAICDDDDIKAISFVGSNVVSHLIIVCFFASLISSVYTYLMFLFVLN